MSRDIILKFTPLGKKKAVRSKKKKKKKRPLLHSCKDSKLHVQWMAMIQTHSHPTEKHFAHFCFVRKQILSNNGDAMNSPPTTHQNEQTLFVHLQDTPSSARCCDLDMGNTIIRLRLEAIIRGPPCNSNTMRGPELKRKKKQKNNGEKCSTRDFVVCLQGGKSHHDVLSVLLIFHKTI